MDKKIINPNAALTGQDLESMLLRIQAIVARLRYLTLEYIGHNRTKFDYPRDPKDAPFIELAIAGKASHIISFDKDLLSLPFGRGDAAKRFRQRLRTTEVIKPLEFLHRYAMNAVE